MSYCKFVAQSDFVPEHNLAIILQHMTILSAQCFCFYFCCCWCLHTKLTSKCGYTE